MVTGPYAFSFVFMEIRKNKMYEYFPPENREDLEERVTDILFDNRQKYLKKNSRKVLKYCEKCVKNDGRHLSLF